MGAFSYNKTLYEMPRSDHRGKTNENHSGLINFIHVFMLKFVNLYVKPFKIY